MFFYFFLKKKNYSLEHKNRNRYFYKTIKFFSCLFLVFFVFYFSIRLKLLFFTNFFSSFQSDYYARIPSYIFNSYFYYVLFFCFNSLPLNPPPNNTRWLFYNKHSFTHLCVTTLLLLCSCCGCYCIVCSFSTFF